MRLNLVMCGLLMTLAGGCAPTFSGQWLEEKGPPIGTQTGMNRDVVRLALDFDPISAVRVGIFDETAGVVDAQSVQADRYTTYEGGKVAQFGAAMARLEGDILKANVAGTSRTFRRWRGKSIFPPMVRLPALAEASPGALPERYVYAWP